MTFFNEDKRSHMLEMVKAGGQEIVDRAEEIVGTDGLVSSIDLTLYFDGSTGIPELNVHRTNLCRNALKTLGNVGTKIRNETLEKTSESIGFVHENPDYYLDSQLTIGKYTATCVKTEVNTESDYVDYTFCFDTYIDEKMPHNEMLSRLDEWFRSYEGFDDIRDDIVSFPYPGYKYGRYLRVPYIGEMFRPEEKWKYYIPDNPDGTWKDQWLCMKDIRNRVTIHNGGFEWGILMNENAETSPFYRVAAYVNCLGAMSSINRSYSMGIRPVFVIRKHAKSEK